MVENCSRKEVMTTFLSIGTPSANFNAPTTPGAPAGFVAGNILVAGFWEHAGSDTAPDLSAFGFTLKSDNSVVKAVTLYTKTALGGDTMPSAQFGTDWCGAFCAAYPGGTEILDRTSAARGASTTTSGFPVPGVSAPPSNNVTAIALGFRNQGSATGVTVSNYGNFVQRGTYLVNSRPHVVFEDIIMTTPQAITLGIQATSPADSANQTSGMVVIFLQSAVVAPVPFPPTSLGGMNVQVCM